MKRLFFSGFFLLVLGVGSTAAAALELTIIPATPVLIYSDFTYTDPAGDEITVPAPWFLLKFGLRNNTGIALTLNNFGIEIFENTLKKNYDQRSLAMAPGDYVEFEFYVGGLPTYTYNYVAALDVFGYVGVDPTADEVTLARTYFTLQK